MNVSINLKLFKIFLVIPFDKTNTAIINLNIDPWMIDYINQKIHMGINVEFVLDILEYHVVKAIWIQE